MVYEILLSNKLQKEIKRISGNEKDKINKCCEKLKENFVAKRLYQDWLYGKKFGGKKLLIIFFI